MRRSARTICVAAVVWLLAIATAKADDSSEEFWPEVDTCWRVSPAWRVSLFVPVSRNVETDYPEGNFIPQVDFAWASRIACTRHGDLRLALRETVNRIRWLNGATVAWTSRYAIEGNVTYQHDTRSSVTNLLAVNVNAHLCLGRPKFQHGQGVAEGH